jgi:ligand-binding SRPBCC domain-containing protein
MRPIRFEHASDIDCSVADLWAFHSRPDALDVLSPPGTRVVDRGRGIAEGSVVTLRLGWWPVTTRWVALHSGVTPPTSFTDVALESPFRFWAHQHLFEARGARTTRLRDVVHVVPPRWLPRWVSGPALAVALRMLFAWRHRRTRIAVARPPRERSCHCLLSRSASGGA